MRLLTILATILLSVATAHSEILFETNFDSIADWEPNQPIVTRDTCWDGGNEGTCVGSAVVPEGFDGWTLEDSKFATSKGCVKITNGNYRGGSGKALTFTDENVLNAGWFNDKILSVKLGADYEEIWVTFWMYFEPGFTWSTANSPGHKFVRITHYKGGLSNPFIFFAAGNQQPVTTGLLNIYNGGSADISYTSNFRYENEYYPTDATPSHDDKQDFYCADGNYSGTGTDFGDEGAPQDGVWQKWEFYAKVNSGMAVEDGIVRYYLDGILVGETTDLSFADVGAQADPRLMWNYVMIGGNHSNSWIDGASESTQEYAVDDFVVSTTRLPVDYVIGDEPPTDHTGTAWNWQFTADN